MNFEDYYNSFFTRVYNYARYRSSCPQEAEDLTSCIFEKLYKRFEDFNPQKATLEVWTFMVAHSAATDYFRRKKIRRFFSLSAEQEDEIPSRETVANAFEQAETEQRLHQALLQLTDKEREIVNLHYYQQLKQREIAAVTGMTQSNVGVLLHRAAKKLKQLLGNGYEKNSTL